MSRFKSISRTSLTIIALTVTVATISIILFSLSLGGTQKATATVTVYQKDSGLGEVEDVCFSAREDCSSLILSLINRARKSIHVMVYSFTLDGLGEALISAKEKGLDVKVVIEEENAYVRGSEYEKLKKAGVDVRLDSNKALMHHKVMIVDGEIVVTGSYNWTKSAEEENDENLVVIYGEGLARRYEEEFERIWSNSK